MNNNYFNKNLVLFVLIGLILFLIFKNDKTEGMSSVATGKVVLKGDYVRDIFDLSLKEIKELPTIEEETIEKYEEQEEEDLDVKDEKPSKVKWETRNVEPSYIVNVLHLH